MENSEVTLPDLTAVTALAGAAVGAVGFLVRKAWPVVRKLVVFVNDVTGEPARPGFAGRPGLMERVQRIEESSDAKTKAIEDLTLEVHKTRGQQLAMSTDMAAVKQRMEQSSEDMSAVKAQLTENGGSSLKDAIVQIRRQVAELIPQQRPGDDGYQNQPDTRLVNQEATP